MVEELEGSIQGANSTMNTENRGSSVTTTWGHISSRFEVRIKPYIRCLVLYYAYGTPNGEFPAGVPRAAMVTGVDEPDNPESPVSLLVFNPTGLFFNQHIPYGTEPGHWSW